MPRETKPLTVPAALKTRLSEIVVGDEPASGRFGQGLAGGGEDECLRLSQVRLSRFAHEADPEGLAPVPAEQHRPPA